MAEYETRELQGSLFKNSSKREGKQDADYQGRCKIGGVEFFISSWLNTSKNGVKYMGLKFKEVQPRAAEATPVPTPPLAPFVPDEQIPF